MKFYVNDDNYKYNIDSYIGERNKYITQEVELDDSFLFFPNDIIETNKYQEYKLTLIGILLDGTKAVVKINGIYPFLDVKLSHELTREDVQVITRSDAILTQIKGSLKIHKYEIIKKKNAIGFDESKSEYLRIHFKNKHHRQIIFEHLDALGHDTANNAISCYYRTVARSNNLNLCYWNKISNFTIIDTDRRCFKSKYYIEVDINNINMMEDDSNKDIRLLKEKFVSCCYDIEEYSNDFDIMYPNKKTRLPSGNIMEDEIFNISMTFQFINDDDSFLNIGLATKEAHENSEYITIICNSEKTLLLTFAYIIGNMSPDYIIEFNGSEFDWVNIADKCKLYHIFNEFRDLMSIKINNTYYNDELDSKYIKINAGSSRFMRSIKTPGFIALDLRILLMREFPKDKYSSLKFYLNKLNLSPKDDIKISDLFRYYKTDDVIGMTKIVHYCYIDSFRLHQMIRKQNIIKDKLEVGRLSFTSAADSFYNANGMKIQNLLIKEGAERGLVFDMRRAEKNTDDKFPGAKVLDPLLGLNSPLLSFREWFAKNKIKLSEEEITEIEKRIYDGFTEYFNYSLN